MSRSASFAFVTTAWQGRQSPENASFQVGLPLPCARPCAHQAALLEQAQRAFTRLGLEGHCLTPRQYSWSAWRHRCMECTRRAVWG